MISKLHFLWINLNSFKCTCQERTTVMWQQFSLISDFRHIYTNDIFGLIYCPAFQNIYFTPKIDRKCTKMALFLKIVWPLSIIHAVLIQVHVYVMCVWGQKLFCYWQKCVLVIKVWIYRVMRYFVVFNAHLAFSIWKQRTFICINTFVAYCILQYIYIYMHDWYNKAKLLLLFCFYLYHDFSIAASARRPWRR